MLSYNLVSCAKTSLPHSIKDAFYVFSVCIAEMLLSLLKTNRSSGHESAGGDSSQLLQSTTPILGKFIHGRAGAVEIIKTILMRQGNQGNDFP